MAKFIRKNDNPDGKYYCVIKVGTNSDTGHSEIKKTIEISGRDVYETDNKVDIEILQKDPEILEFTGKIDKK